MNGFKKTARIAGTLNGTVTFPTVTEGLLPLPSRILNFNLGYGTAISFTCLQDMSNVSLTVTGKFNNIPVTETFVGPNNSSVSTKYYYDTLISISASASNANDLYMTIDYSSIVVLDNYDVNTVNNYNLNKFSILASSLSVNSEGWGQANYFVYGVNGTRPSLITTEMINPNIVFQPVEPFEFERAYPSVPYFYFINPVGYYITQNDLQNGYIVTTEYPFDSIIVAISNNILQTPSIIEIVQS